jgi:hypothetical protein
MSNNYVYADFIPYGETVLRRFGEIFTEETTEEPIKRKKLPKYSMAGFIPYKDLPKEAKAIIRDRGKHYRYRVVSTKDLTQIFCRVPEGYLLTGVAFYKKGDEFYIRKGIQIAAGRLEAEISVYEGDV